MENIASKDNKQDVISLIADLKSHGMKEGQVTYATTISIWETTRVKEIKNNRYSNNPLYS